MNTTELFLVAMILIFALPWLVWRLGRTEYWAPLVVVQIVGGVLLGPGALGAAFPGAYAGVFTPPVVGALNGVAWWGVMLFVFLAGVELDLESAWKERAASAATAASAFAAPMALGCGAAALLVASHGGWVGPEAATWQFVAGIGMASAVTALPILVLLMEKVRLLREPLGQRALRYASLDDIAIWSVLALVLADWQRIGRQAVFLLAFALAAWAFRALMRRLPEADRWFASLVWLPLVALGADWCGLHYMIGAFLAGAVIDARWFGAAALDGMRRHVLWLLMPVFFLSTGLRTQWSVGGVAVFGAAALLLAAAVGGKLLGVWWAARRQHWPAHEAGVLGWLLQTKGLIEIIFASVLLDKGIISASTFTALLLMAVASTMLTVPMVTPRLARWRAAQAAADASATAPAASSPPAPSARPSAASSSAARTGAPR